MNDDVVFKALADESRRQLLDALYDNEPQRLSDLLEVLDMSRAGVQKHIRILEAAGLVLTKRHGRETHHFLNAVPIESIYQRWVTKFASRWSTGLLDLKRTVEEKGMKQSKEVSLNRLEIKQEIAIRGDRATVFAALTEGMAYWWGAPYLIAPEGAKDLDIVLEPHLDGKVYETWGDGNGAMWGRITYISKDEGLEITGQIGMSGAMFGEVRFDLREEADATIVSLSHIAVGTLPDSVYQSYEGGWTDLMGRLKVYVEEGTISGVKS